MDQYRDLYIGDTIKELRFHFGISQKDLASGICTQSLISQIENESIVPNSILLKQIAYKLGISLDSLFLMAEYPKFNFVQNFRELVTKHIVNNDYFDALKLLKLQTNKSSLKKGNMYQFVLWAEGVCVYYEQKNTSRSIQILNAALNLSDSLIFSFQDAQILNSLAIIHAEEGKLKQSIGYFEKIVSIHDKLPFLTLNPLLTKVYYNLAKVLTLQELYEKSIDYCHVGISRSLKDESISNLGELYYQLGVNHEKMGNVNESIEWYQKSKSILDMKIPNDRVSIVNEKLSKLC
ncbi:helix-turn-helix domain-containing protein [Bacillus spongiae]|uniref:Helix-turn-helix domain-containing protein n=1 Tax=Bacillus spongiae TaxID=2683610 RepID=A0ABU8HJ14_9BACI